MERDDVDINDVLITRDQIVRLGKRARRRSQTPFPLFNCQYVAISDTESDTIAIFKVVKEGSGIHQWWSQLESEPIAVLNSQFVRQVRHVTSGRPLLHCNGELHLLQIIVSYANHYKELIEIFPSRA